MKFLATTVAAGLLALSLTATSWAQDEQGKQTVQGQLVFLHSFVTGQPLLEKGKTEQERPKLMGPPVLAIHTQEDKLVILDVAKLRREARARRKEERQQMGVTPEEQWKTIKERAHKYINQEVTAEGTMYSKAGVEYLVVDSIHPMSQK